MKLDLHVHTTYSDGDLTPREAVDTAKQKRLKCIAITDHDECRGYGDVADETGILVVPGIELAAKFEGEVHILGLMIDWRSPRLLEHVESVASLRAERARSMIDKLNEAGVDLTMEDVERESAGIIGRPHIGAALVKKGYAGTVKEAFTKYLSKHTQFYVPFDKISVEQAASLINGAGGKAILAHPGLAKEDVRRKLIPKLAGMGFWGIEAYHHTHTNGQCREFESLARRNGLFVTAGSDFHGSAKPEIEIGSETRGGAYLKKSVEALGITCF
jgi:predicted metal-dependent phosphoesterase TrpH